MGRKSTEVEGTRGMRTRMAVQERAAGPGVTSRSTAKICVQEG